MRRKISLWALAATGLLALPLLSACGQSAPQSSGQSSTPAAADTTVIGMTYIPNVQFAPVYVAADNGLFSAEGVTAKIRHHGSDEGLFSALISGDEQVTVAFGDELLQARAQGAPLVSIGAYYHHYPVEIIVPEDSDIKDLADLRGKKIGLPGEFGSNWFGLQAALKSADLSTDEVQVVSVGYTQAAALVAGDVDAVVGFSNSEAVQLQQLNFPMRAIALDPEETPLVGASIVTTEEWLAANPDRARGVVAAITEGTQQVIDDPQAALEVTKQWDQTLSDSAAEAGALATLQATVPLWTAADGKASGFQDLDTWEKMGPFLAGILGEPALATQVEGAATNDYVQ